MATINQDLKVGLQTSKGEDIEEVSMPAGTQVDIIKEWEHFYLVKDEDGHFYNLRKEVLEP